MKTKMTTTTTNKETQSVLVVETKATRRRINRRLVTIGRRVQGCVDRLWRNRDTSKCPWCRPKATRWDSQKSGKFLYNLNRRACNIVVATCVAAKSLEIKFLEIPLARWVAGWLLRGRLLVAHSLVAAGKIARGSLARCCGEDFSSLARCCGEDGIRRAKGRRGAAAPLVRQSVSKIRSFGKLNLNYFFEMEK